jgi:hypothetical protein
MLVLVNEVGHALNEKRQIVPIFEKLTVDEIGAVEQRLADAGRMSTANVEACERAGIESMVAMLGSASRWVA